ncbi:polymer-forming cytoskeletal protein [Ferruginibacter paludis]|uniref:bactofilin family protein n=1 Tax=Ferruginibacter paludis TaxID=1310417 RepID=UPI0025B3997B|nr:polymer-forming cytoskeletal protein [Ferruginibacter paludis]MDN3655809.1 polymer-forming cytoskeletal protein [Ferruginibacter paludis]
MFNSKSKSGGSEAQGGSTTIIGAGTTINGNIESTGDIRIDGTLIGNLTSKAKVLVGADGVIDGAIKGKNADVLGKVTGQMDIKEILQLRGKCIIDGDIFAGKLEVEPTATFNGRCHMGANVVELNVELSTAVNQ